MRNVICVWNNGKGEFEQNIPLEYIALRYEKLGYATEFDVVVLSGFDNFSSGYKDSLSRSKFRLIDCGGLYKEAEFRNPSLARFGDYELKCFLRWIVLHELYQSEPLIHYDGDVVCNENPGRIAELLTGRTFVLQGCPAFTCIGDPDRWYGVYRAALDEFTSDIEAYSSAAWYEREGWEQSENEKWAGQRFRKTISSDQDFLSHLIHTGKIIQDSPQSVLDSLRTYTMFENPLFINGYHPWNFERCTYNRIGAVDYINGLRVLFWHMQCDFVHYLSKYLIMATTLHCTAHKCRLPYAVSSIMPETAGYQDDRTSDVHNWMAELLNKFIGRSRLEIYRHFFDNENFSPVFQQAVWWNSNVFK